MRTLLIGGFSPESSTLLVAANRGYFDIFSDLIMSGLSPGPFVLTAAASMGHNQIVEVLLSRNLRPEPLAIIATAGSGHISTLRLLLDNVHVQQLDKSALSLALKDAAKFGHSEIVRMLIDFGVRDSQALTEAISADHDEVVEVMLGLGFVPTKRDWVVARRFPRVRKLLKDNARMRRLEAWKRVMYRVIPHSK
ncbi:hypothetical protein HDU97_009377 [Phlyctochytrium planicorne]|nr:hypothetical protein HDU97_009377 [Phlyctochytrium planicorne]